MWIRTNKTWLFSRDYLWEIDPSCEKVLLSFGNSLMGRNKKKCKKNKHSFELIDVTKRSNTQIEKRKYRMKIIYQNFVFFLSK